MIGEIFAKRGKGRIKLIILVERAITLMMSSRREQPQRNLLVDLRPVTNAMAQHALGAGTENVDYYRETES